MQQNVITIKCPSCGKVMQVADMPNINQKYATCVACKTRRLVGEYLRVQTAQQEENTQYPGSGGAKGHAAPGSEETQTNLGGQGGNTIIGRLTVAGTGQSFQLRPGRQVIGRQGSNPPLPDFGIATDNRRVSRQHIVVEVKKIPGKGYVHYASLFKERVNATYVGNTQLAFGDTVVLRHGDILRLPDTELRFELPDEEGTLL